MSHTASHNMEYGYVTMANMKVHLEGG